jgi:hypothetical protein
MDALGRIKAPLAALTITVLALAVATYQIDFAAFLSELHELAVWQVTVAGMSLLAGAVLAALRLRFVASDLGIRLSVRDSMAAFTLGQVAGVLFFQFFGQVFARSAYLSSRGVSMPANIAISVYERAIAFGVSAGLALYGASVLFGGVAIDLGGGGAKLIYLVAGLAVSIATAACWGWGAEVRRAFAGLDRRTLFAVSRNTAVTIGIQATTAFAYVALVRAAAPAATISAMAAASFIVMFTASLPISFAGWGVRELSAVFALKLIGVSTGFALVVSILIGLLSLAVVAVVGLTAVTAPAAAVRNIEQRVRGFDAPAFLMLVIPLAAATAVLFQIYVPTADGNLSVNLADPVVLLGGCIFVWLAFRRPEAVPPQVSYLYRAILAVSVVMIGAFLLGWERVGFTNWAFTNRLLGWFVLLCFAATGVLGVIRLSPSGLRLLANSLAGSAVGIVIIESVVVMFARAGYLISDLGYNLPLDGFSQNRNAFAFALLVVLSAMPAVSARLRPLLFVCVGAGLVLSGSRAGYGAAILVVAILLTTRFLTLRQALQWSAVAAAFVALILWVPEFTIGLLNYFGVAAGEGVAGAASVVDLLVSPEISNVERWSSIVGGWGLFLGHPVFGAGLGAFLDQQMKMDHPLIIHSTPLWIAAEMGIVGVTAFAALFGPILYRAIVVRDAPAVSILGMLSVMAVMGLVHELMYQRVFWLMLGAALAASAGSRTAADQPIAVS